MRRPALAAVGIAALVITVWSVGGNLINNDNTSSATTVTVPDLPGLTSDTAYDQLNAAGLTGRSERAGWTSSHVIVSTDPAAGTTVPAGTQVDVVEMEKDEVTFYAEPMPDLTGVEWIKFAESPAGPTYPFFVQATWRKPARGEKQGTIVEQTPAAGAALKLGEPIKVTVAEYQPGPDSGSYGNWDIDIDLPNACRRTQWC